MKPLNNQVQVIYNWHDKPVRVNLKKYWKRNPLDYVQLPKRINTTNKITYSKRIINDFVEVVNNRQEIVNGIVNNANQFLKASQKVQDCFAEYYSPEKHFQQDLDKILDTVKPEFRYIKAVAHQNLRKIHSLLQKQKQQTKPDEEQQPIKLLTKKNKLFILCDPKNVDVLKNETQRLQTITTDKNEDRLTTQYKQLIQKTYQREIEKQNRIQKRLFDSELKYQGNDYIKQNIFKNSMKSSNSPQTLKNNYYVNKSKHVSQETPKNFTQSHFKTTTQSRCVSNFNTPTNGSTELFQMYDSIKEEQSKKNINTLNNANDNIFKKRSYQSFNELVSSQPLLQKSNQFQNYLKSSSQQQLMEN